MKERFQVIVLAAGKGVRMRSALPKVLHRVCGHTLIERVLRTVVAVGAQSGVVVVGHGREMVEQEIARLHTLSFFSERKFAPVFQSEQLGTGHAVQTAWSLIDREGGSVLILPGDVPLLSAQTIQGLLREEADLVVLSAVVPSPRGYGRIVRSPEGRVLGIVEEKDCTAEQRGIKEINTSVYLVSPLFLEKALPTLQAENAQREFYLTDIVKFGVENGFTVKAVTVQNHHEVLGVNSRFELAAVEKIRQNVLALRLMEGGVSLEDPNSVYLHEGVRVGEDSFLGAGTRLYGETTLGANVTVEGECLIVDSHIADGTHVKLGCVIESSRVGAECEVGPFAHLRPGTELGAKVKIGNFVETKKSVLGEGAKANHLSYIGDATVGKGANIGAGTITCNYDGFSKYETVIGEGAFIGSNSSLIAPVSIGDRAVVGAGSAISKDVPADALGLERAPQKTVENWSERRQKRSVDLSKK